MARRNTFEENYRRLEQLLQQRPEDLKPETAYRLVSPHDCFMDLIVERLLPCEDTGAVVLSLAHYVRQHGDLCQDPEMTVRIFPSQETRFQHLAPSTTPDRGRVEALTFQQAIPPIYQEVYPEPGHSAPRLKQELNSFLQTWLRNLNDQQHRLVEEGDGQQKA